MALLSEIETLLSTVTNLETGSIPKSPDDIVCIRLSGGGPRSLSGTFVEEPSFQVYVRAAKFADAETMCTTVKNLLHGSSTTKALMIQQQGDTLPLGKDENNRHLFSINFRCYYRD